jgi:hypothetical protein
VRGAVKKYPYRRKQHGIMIPELFQGELLLLIYNTLTGY